MANVNLGTQGRRGYYAYEYGSHFWVPQVMVDFSGGMKRDMPRELIPEGAAYTLQDMIVSPQGFAYKRGGWAYAGPALGSGSPAGVQFVYDAPFNAGDQVLGVDYTGGHLYKVTSGTTTDIGSIGVAGSGITGSVAFMQKNAATQYLVIPRGATGVPKLYDGTSLSDMGGSPPSANIVCVHVSRLVLAWDATNPNRVWFSPVPDFTSTWDTTNSWIDFPGIITGLASLQNTLLVWTNTDLYKLVGDTPPPGTNMTRSKVGSVGMFDPRNVCVNRGIAYWTNKSGVYRTNGVTIDNLTTLAGVQTLWNSQSAVGQPGPCVVFNDQYLLARSGNTGQTLCIYLPTLATTLLTNIDVSSFALSPDQTELYASSDPTNSNRVFKLASLFSPAAAVKADGDGTNVLPQLETRPFGQFPFLTAFGKGFLTYQMIDAASDNPTLTVEYHMGINNFNYTAVPESGFAESASTLETRKRFKVGQSGNALTLRLTQVGPSQVTEFHALEVQTRAYPRGTGGIS